MKGNREDTNTLSEENTKQLFSCGKEKEAMEILGEDYNRRENDVVNINKYFSKDNVKNISDLFFSYGI